MNTEIFLVRHGEPTLTNALLGSTDSPLSELGWRQLTESCKTVNDIDGLVSSPLSRCAAFAQELSERSKLPLSIKAEWAECHFGEWDGKLYQELHQEKPKELNLFFNRPDRHTPPGGERLIDFSQRVENALKKLHQEYAGKRVLVVTHAGVIRTIVAWCLQMDYESGLQFRRFSIDYASVTHLSIFMDEQLFPQIRSLNIRPLMSLVN